VGWGTKIARELGPHPPSRNVQHTIQTVYLQHSIIRERLRYTTDAAVFSRRFY